MGSALTFPPLWCPMLPLMGTLESTPDSPPSTATTTASARLRLSPTPLARSTDTTLDTPTSATATLATLTTTATATATPATTTDKSFLKGLGTKSNGTKCCSLVEKTNVLLTCVTAQ